LNIPDNPRIALVNELAILFNRLGLDTQTVLDGGASVAVIATFDKRLCKLAAELDQQPTPFGPSV